MEEACYLCYSLAGLGRRSAGQRTILYSDNVAAFTWNKGTEAVICYSSFKITFLAAFVQPFQIIPPFCCNICIYIYPPSSIISHGYLHSRRLSYILKWWKNTPQPTFKHHGVLQQKWYPENAIYGQWTEIIERFTIICSFNLSSDISIPYLAAIKSESSEASTEP